MVTFCKTFVTFGTTLVTFCRTFVSIMVHTLVTWCIYMVLFARNSDHEDPLFELDLAHFGQISQFQYLFFGHNLQVFTKVSIFFRVLTTNC